MKVLDPALKTIVHIPNVNSRESTEGQAHERSRKSWTRLATWKGVDPATGFHLIEVPGGRVIKVADLVR